MTLKLGQGQNKLSTLHTLYSHYLCKMSFQKSLPSLRYSSDIGREKGNLNGGLVLLGVKEDYDIPLKIGDTFYKQTPQQL